MNRWLAAVTILIGLIGIAYGQPTGTNTSPQSSSLVIGTTPITNGATTQVLFNLGGVVTSDNGLTYAGSGGPLETALGTAAAPVIANNVSPTTGLYWRAVNGQGFGYAQVGTLTFDCNITTSNACTVSNNVNLTVSGTGVVNALSLGLGGGGNITFATRTKLTSNGTDGGLLVSNNAGTQTFAMATTATAGQAGFVGGMAATLATATGTNVVCNTPGTTTAITVQVSATGCAASSERFKERIASIDSDKAFQVVMALRPISYFYRRDYADDPDKHIGFTAEQVDTVPPPVAGYSMITMESDGVTPHAVKYNEMAPLFVAAIQKLQREITDLKSQLGVRQ